MVKFSLVINVILNDLEIVNFFIKKVFVRYFSIIEYINI